MFIATGYPHGDVRRYQSSGAADWTVALQNCAMLGGGFMIFPPNATLSVSSTITLPATGIAIEGSGSTLSADGAFDLFKCQGTTTIERLTLTRAAVAGNTSWKAINFDGGGYSIAPQSRLRVRDCAILGFDIGVYTDGTGASQPLIDYAEVSSCRIVINPSGTGGGTSIRPTVNLNNCLQAVVRDCYLNASDPVGAVNNLYFMVPNKSRSSITRFSTVMRSSCFPTPPTRSKRRSSVAIGL